MATPQGPQVCVAVLRVVRVSGRGLRGVAVLKPELQVVHDDGREVFEGLDVLGVECARLAVQDAQGPQVEAVTGAQRDACVEPKPELARYQRVRQRTHVDCRVLDDPSAILHEGPWIIEDAAVDVRALSNPLVAGEFGLRFYAGIPLRTRDGFNLGTLCILDREPRTLDTQDVKALEDLAAIVMNDLELRLENRHAPETTARHADYP